MFFHFDFLEGAEPKIFRRPRQILVANEANEVQDCLVAVEQAVACGAWAAGFVSYEAASGFDPGLVTHEPGRLPLVVFGLFSRPEPVDWAGDEPGPSVLGDWRILTPRSAYHQAFLTIQDAISQGQTYQVNYSTRIKAEFWGDARALYRQLQAAQQGRYGAYAEWEEFSLISASPELFFRVDDGRILCRPMKGTIGRGRFSAEDEAQMRALQESAKDRAENVMIVDLIRNDLGKVAATGSVATQDLFRVERYPTLYSMTSTVTADLPSDRTWRDVMTALFPCGSITGAPKASTMRIIQEVEGSPRGIYCGTLGYVSPDGHAVFNVAIRTLTIDRRRGWAEFSAGGGITADSNECLEYAEVQTKSQFLIPAPWSASGMDLLETMRLEQGRYTLLEAHVARLQASAEYFGRPCSESQVLAKLHATAGALTEGGWRIRLLLDAAGGVAVEAFPWQPTPADNPRVAWAHEPVSSQDRMLFHKTNHRARYVNWHPPDSGFFDHLLWNDEGYATEFTRGNLVAEVNGTLWTPPIECGLLPGTMRQWLLDGGWIKMARLTRSEVEAADQLWFINSLEGWIPVELQTDA